MSRHALLVVNTRENDGAALSRDLMQRYCRREGYDFVELREAKLNLHAPGIRYNFQTFEKFQIYDVLGAYDRVLRLDTDVLVSPLAPDIFNVVPEHALGVVYEDVADKAGERRQQMEKICAARGSAPWGERRYFNSGVMVCSKAHRAMFKLDASDIESLTSGGMGGFKEQNTCNWKARECGCELFELDYRFNHLRFFSDRKYGHHPRFKSFFLHYAGSQRKKDRRMNRDRAPLLRAWDTNRPPKPPITERLFGWLK